jgi:ATP-dependent helicase/nuclease subunit A
MSNVQRNPKSEIRNSPAAGEIRLEKSGPSKAGTGRTAQQNAAIDAKNVSVVLSAGAGCGKTSVLTDRFLSHLSPGPHHADLSRLVAITFTERAAREMRERIRAKCLERLQTAPADEVQHWLKIVSELDSARISTIHSFCSSLLRSNAVEAGIDPRFGLLDETLGASFLRQSVRIGLHQLLAGNDPDALELVFEYGLTRAQYLLATLVEERYRINSAEWNETTARELATRWDRHWHSVTVPQLLREIGESEPARTTFKLLRENVPHHPVMQERREALLGQIPLLTQSPEPGDLLESLKQNARVQGGGTKKDWDSEDVYVAVKDALADFRSLIEKAIDQLDYDPEHLLRGAEMGLCALRATAKIGAIYDERKAEAGLVDFDDLLLGARNLLRDHDDVCRRTAAGIALLMVDEFQDTDPIQNDIVRMLCGEALLKGRLFVVGDAKQSIYRFRRAQPRVFHELRQKVPSAGRLPLSVNFRSQPQVLQFVNAVFDGALGPEYEALEAHAGQLSPKPCVEFLFSAAGAEEIDDETAHSAAARRRREGDWIARRLTQLLGDGVSRVRGRDPATGEPQLRPIRKKDIVILFRAMSDVRYYEEALRHHGLDYYVVGGRAFFAQQEIFDLVNLCQFLDDVDDQAALVGVLRSPFFSLSDDAIFALGRSPARSLYVPPPPNLSEEQKKQITFAAEVLSELREKKDRLPIARLLTLAIDRTGYDASLLTEFLGARKLANLRKLLDMARQFDQSGLFTLADFVDRLREAVAEETHESLAATHPESSDVIRLMSIHQSKGLEFPVVVIADMDRRGRDQAPLARFDPDLGPLVALPEKFGERRDHLGMRIFRLGEREEDLAESRRLFYVAATRAADLLILSANLKSPGRPSNPWLKLLAERFDLLTGQPRQAPTVDGMSILVKYPGRLPEILVHQAPPEAIILAHDASKQPPLAGFRELVDQAEPIPLPKSMHVFPPDNKARRRFSVSQIETLDAELRSEASAAPFAARRVPDDRSELADGDLVFAELSASEQLGILVHAAFERIDFQNPPSLGRLIDDCCGLAAARVDKPMRAAAQACLENLLASPLRADLAAARQLHREVDFLLMLPVSKNGTATSPPLHKAGPGGGPSTQTSIVIAGTIDCLFESADGKWHVLDYKTGIRDRSAPADELLADYEIQLGLYALAVRELIGRPPDRTELVFVRQGIDRVVFEPTEDRLADVISRVNQVIHREMRLPSSL